MVEMTEVDEIPVEALRSSAASDWDVDSAAPAAGLWTGAATLRYARQMLMEQLRAVLPIAVFLVGYQRLVLQIWPTNPWALAGGIAAAVLGLAIFMEGLKFGLVRTRHDRPTGANTHRMARLTCVRPPQMPLGEAVGVAMARRLGRVGILALACALGVLVTLAEPAIGSARPRRRAPVPPRGESAVLCGRTLKEAAKLVDVEKAPYLYATMNLWTNYLQLTIGLGVGLASSTGMLRSIFGWSLKPLIYALVPFTMLLTCAICFFTDMEEMVGLAWCVHFLVRPVCGSRYLINLLMSVKKQSLRQGLRRRDDWPGDGAADARGRRGRG